MTWLAIMAIRAYQTFISPYKGFRCAHAHLHQQDSCSGAVIKLIQTYGVLKALPFIKQRFNDCRTAYEIIEEKNKNKEKKKNDRCDYCDVIECSGETACRTFNCGKSSNYCDNFSVCDCSLF